MTDFSVFINAFPVFPLVVAMMALGVVIFAPNTAKWGVQKIESLFGVSFKDGFARLERQNQEKLGLSMARDAAREYYKNNPRKNRPVPYRFWRK